MGLNVTQTLIQAHLVEGEMIAGREIGIKVHQTLTHDATGPLVMLQLEAMGLDRVKTDLSVQYVDHNILQQDHKNPDDHLFLRSACQRFGLWYSGPGNGVSHPVHQERFGKPGKVLLGADSHTPAAGSIGMLAIGAGGQEVAMAMAGMPFHLRMPDIWGVKLVGDLPDWVSAKDVILEMLRRHDVDGAVHRIIEYYGPGLESLSVMDRHVVANMGTELGATTTVFPSDQEVKRFLRSQGREEDWSEIVADKNAQYDIDEEIDLSQLEPLIAKPCSPGNVVPVREIQGMPIYQTYIGSSANPGYRDLAVAARIVEGRKISANVSFDLNPASRQVLENLARDGHLVSLIRAGGRIHQVGCNGCIGMGQAPATDRISLRTVPRNFPGRSGTPEDQVYLVSPETAAASALTSVITDPRKLPMDYPKVKDPESPSLNINLLEPPLALEEAANVQLQKAANIVSLPQFDRLPDHLEIPVLLKVADDLSTDEILPAGPQFSPYRSNILKSSEFAFFRVDTSYPERASEVKGKGGHAVVGRQNYGQGSSREHAALAPRCLGLRVVIAMSFGRIHWQNLINCGVLPLTFKDESDYQQIEQSDLLRLNDLRNKILQGSEIEVAHVTNGNTFLTEHQLSARQVDILLAGGMINWAGETVDQADN